MITLVRQVPGVHRLMRLSKINETDSGRPQYELQTHHQQPDEPQRYGELAPETTVVIHNPDDSENQRNNDHRDVPAEPSRSTKGGPHPHIGYQGRTINHNYTSSFPTLESSFLGLFDRPSC